MTTLVLPWAGCQYARELENTLRISQESSLQAAASTIANALSAQPQRVFPDVGDAQGFHPEQGDFYLYPLHSQPLLDGYVEDWDVGASPVPLPSNNLYTARFEAAYTERYIWLYIEVDDSNFEPEPSDVRPVQDRFDRVNLVMQAADGTSDSYFFATGAPGLIAAQTTVEGDDGTDHAETEPRIQAYWLQLSKGYRIEARIPRSMVHSRLWIEAIDGGGTGRAGFMGANTQRGGRLFMGMPGLNELLATFVSLGTRATVIDINALKLGTAGTLAASGLADKPSSDGWHRRFMDADSSHWPEQVSAPDHLEGRSVVAALGGQPSAEWQRFGARGSPLLVAAAPIAIHDRPRGAVVVEQTGDQLLGLRDRALLHLIYMTFFATALAVAFAVGIATWISLRIARLGRAADTAIGIDGTINLQMPESKRDDEIGTLARAFEGLLARLNEHTQYLRTLGGKLSHELRTPLTIVRSSLDNLESDGVRTDQRGYLTRAREGVSRLQFILTALGAASRVEESIKQTEKVNFDLRKVLHCAVEGYREGFRGVRIELEAPLDACYLHGAPDLIVQMLDKLVENAVDFCVPTGAIFIHLRRAGAHYEMTVANDGPLIPNSVLTRLFDSLFEHRQGREDKPHFGLGLYIVRLVAEFHSGKAIAANRTDGAGAVFTIELPLI